MFRKLTATFLLCISVDAAEAGVTQKTLYQYFPVSGTSAKSLYASMVHGSGMNGDTNDLATTDPSLKTNLITTKGAGCKVVRIDVAMGFLVKLPQLKNEASLPPAIAHDWRGFVAHLKWHEEHHRSLWMACARHYDAALKPLLNKPCGNLQAVMSSRWAEAERMCKGPNTAFDKDEYPKIRAMPFIRRVLAGE